MRSTVGEYKRCKILYNERLKVLTELKDSATRELADVKQKMEYALKKSENFRRGA